MNEIYCARPFRDIYSDSFGRYMPCCHAVANHPNRPHHISTFESESIEDMSLMEWYNSSQMQRLRSDMSSGKITPLISDVCRSCIDSEYRGFPSGRQPHMGDFPERKFYIKLRIFGNACNLSCYMCHIKNSTSRISQTQKLIDVDPLMGDILKYDLLPESMKHGNGFDFSMSDPETFNRCIEDLKRIAHRIEFINIIGGEPFIMSSHYKVLDALIECGESKNITLLYNSNLTKLHWQGCKVTDYIKHFKSVSVQLSLEAIGDRNDYIRFGSVWEDVVSNMMEIRPLLAKFDAAICLSSLAILSLNETLEWCDKNNLEYIFHDVQDPDPCRIDYLHPKIRSRLLKEYSGTVIEKSLSADVEDWQERWDIFIRYLNALDTVNKTDHKKVFPELYDL